MPWFRKEMGTGALVDARSAQQVKRDYSFEEIVASQGLVDWREKSIEQCRKFPISDQNGSGSCVAHTAAKLLGISYQLKNTSYPFVRFSSTDIYQQRSNRPAGGMAADDVFRIIRNNGATLEELVPSQKMTDRQMDSTSVAEHKREIGKIFRVSNSIVVPTQSIETVASILSTTRKGVMVWFFFTGKEWTNTPQVLNKNLSLYAPETLRHSVTAVDFGLVRGKKALFIEDSWGLNHGFLGRRIITEDFFKARNFYAGYLMNFSFATDKDDTSLPADRPRYTFNNTLQHEQRGREILILQDILKYEGLFPKNVTSTGFYGGITAKAVYDFQVKYQVATLVELNALQGMYCGFQTLKALNDRYGK